MRKPSSRVIMNRKGLNDLGLAVADGLAEVGQTIIDTAAVPDAPPLGQGLVEAGDWGVWRNGRKVAGTAAKPRGAKTGLGIQLLVGWGFPARFVHEGTVDTAPNPFATRTLDQVLPHLAEIVRSAGRFR
jgi:hypothetical protein